MSNLRNKRLAKELVAMKKTPTNGIDIIDSSTLEEWKVRIRVPENQLYKDQTYCLRLKFSTSYPIEAPETVFLATRESPTIPVHPHVYGNGHICLDLLYQGWSPVQTCESVCMSIQSMLASNTKNERPPDNDQYVRHAGTNPKKTNFVFHDDTV